MASSAANTVLLVDHDEFDLDAIARRPRLYLLDTRHRVAGPHVEYL